MNRRILLIVALFVFAAVQETSAFTAGIGNMGIKGKRDLVLKVRHKNSRRLALRQ